MPKVLNVDDFPELVACILKDREVPGPGRRAICVHQRQAERLELRDHVEPGLRFSVVPRVADIDRRVAAFMAALVFLEGFGLFPFFRVCLEFLAPDRVARLDDRVLVAFVEVFGPVGQAAEAASFGPADRVAFDQEVHRAGLLRFAIRLGIKKALID